MSAMASKIIQFRPRSETATDARLSYMKAPRERAEALPEWLKELNVDWVFQAADDRLRRR